MPTRKRLAQRGFVLLICIAVLALLALLASSFTLLSRTERNASHNYLDKARAKFLAEAGIETAIAQLKLRARSQSWEDLTAPPVNGAPYYNPVYRDGWGIPIEYAKSPSFQAFQAQNPAPVYPAAATPIRNLTAFPTDFSAGIANNNGISGALESTYDGGWDCYTLKVLDCQGQIDLNANLPQATYTAMLENLGYEIQQYLALPQVNYQGRTGKPPVNPIQPGTGTAIYNLRQGMGASLATQKFKSKSDVMPVIPFPGATQQQQIDAFACLQDFVCVNCYRDMSVCVPTALPFPNGSYAPPAYSGGWYGRAPININTAPFPVLVAWVQGVTGSVMTSNPSPAAASGGYGLTTWSKNPSAAIQQSQAEQIAWSIIRHRDPSAPNNGRPFHTLDEVMHFIQNPYFNNYIAQGREPENGYDLMHDGSINLTAGQAAALQAMLNPNLTTNKFFESGQTWVSMDKMDLTYYTAEVCFSSMGYFEVESMGRVLPPNRTWPNLNPPTPGMPPLNIEAEAKVKAVVQVYSVFRQTTQNDFSPPSAQYSKTITLPERNNFPASTWEGGVTLAEVPMAGPPPNPAPPNACAWAAIDSNYGWTGWAPPAIAQNSVAAPDMQTAAMVSGGDLQAEGQTFIPNVQKTRMYQMAGGPPPDEGALEFWVKLTVDPSVSTTWPSGEPLIYLLTEYTPNPNTGAGVKIERFGTKLYATRWFWGYPGASVSPYYMLSSSYQLGDISQWHAGSWHHLALEWKDYNDVAGQPGNGDQQQWQNQGDHEQQDLWFWIDGKLQTNYYPRWDPTIVQRLPGGVIMTTQYRMALASKAPPYVAGQPQNGIDTTVDLGCYSMLSSGVQLDYVNGTKPAQSGPLVSNTVIDNLILYSSGSDPNITIANANSTPPWVKPTTSPTPNNPGWHHNSDLPGLPRARYSAVGGGTYTSSFDLNALRAAGKISVNGVLGTITWQTRLPAWTAMGLQAPPGSPNEAHLWPSQGPGDQSSYVNCSWPVFNGYNPPATPNTFVNAPGGSPYPLNFLAYNPPPNATIRLGAAPSVPYTLTFLDQVTANNNSTPYPFDSAPVVEEVDITVIDSPHFYSWEAY